MTGLSSECWKSMGPQIQFFRKHHFPASHAFFGATCRFQTPYIPCFTSRTRLFVIICSHKRRYCQNQVRHKLFAGYLRYSKIQRSGDRMGTTAGNSRTEASFDKKWSWTQAEFQDECPTAQHVVAIGYSMPCIALPKSNLSPF